MLMILVVFFSTNDRIFYIKLRGGGFEHGASNARANAFNQLSYKPPAL